MNKKDFILAATLSMLALSTAGIAHTPSACPNWSNIDEKWRQGCQGGGYWSAQHAERFNRNDAFIPMRFIIINNTNHSLSFKRGNTCQVAEPAKETKSPLLVLTPKDDPMRKNNSGEAALTYKIYDGSKCNKGTNLAKVSVQYGSPPSINAANRTWSMVYNSLDKRIEMSSHDVSELLTFPNYPAVLITDREHEPPPAIIAYRNILVPNLISDIENKTTKNPNLYKFPKADKHLYYNIPEFGLAGAGSEPAKDYGGLLGTFITSNIKQKNYSFQWCYTAKDNNRCNPSLLNSKKITSFFNTTKNKKNIKYRDFIISIDPLPDNTTSYAELYTFGDSITDTHNTYLLSKGDLPRGPFYNGRWTDGLTWADYVHKYSGIPLRNYAFGGARIQAPTNNNIASKTVTGFKNWDIGWFMPSGLPYIPSVQQQITMASQNIKKSLQHGNVVVAVFAGANDILDAIMSPDKAFPNKTCNLRNKKNRKDVGACMAKAMLKNLDKIRLASLNAKHRLQVHIMLLPDITIASQVFYYIKNNNKKNNITRNDVQAWIKRYNTILKNHFLHHNKVASTSYLNHNAPTANIKWVIDRVDQLVESTLENPTFYGFSANGSTFKPTQHWGARSAPKEVVSGANWFGFNAMIPHHKLHPLKGHMEGWLDIPNLIYYNPQTKTQNIIGGGLHPSTIMQFILGSKMMYSLYVNSDKSTPHNFSSNPTAQLMIQTKGYKYENVAQLTQPLAQLRKITQQLPELATFASPAAQKQIGSWSNGCTGKYSTNSDHSCSLSESHKSQERK